jgi:hypothetical protein
MELAMSSKQPIFSKLPADTTLNILFSMKTQWILFTNTKYICTLQVLSTFCPPINMAFYEDIFVVTLILALSLSNTDVSLAASMLPFGHTKSLNRRFGTVFDPIRSVHVPLDLYAHLQSKTTFSLFHPLLEVSTQRTYSNKLLISKHAYISKSETTTSTCSHSVAYYLQQQSLQSPSFQQNC